MSAPAPPRESMAKIALIAGLVFGLLSSSEPALACDAPPDIPLDPAERVRSFDVVARGTVTSFSSWTVQTEDGWDQNRVTYWIAELLGYDARIVIGVDEAWKGVEFDELVVHEDGPDSCCGMRFVEVGDEVLVYAREHDGKLWVNGACVPMIPIAKAQPDLDYLGPGLRELRSRRWIRPLGRALAIAALVGALLYRRRKMAAQPTRACA